jgi:hypothetical protein
MNEAHVSDRLGGHLEGDLSLAERALVDAHLARCEECELELRELRATVAMLRGLTDPEPPDLLCAQVMRRIESEAARSSTVVEFLRRASAPRFASALAAGFAGVMLFGYTVFGAGDFLGTSSDSPLDRVASERDSSEATDTRVAEARRPLPSRRVSVRRRPVPSVREPGGFVAFEPDVPFRRPAPWGGSPRFGFYASAAPEVPLRDLDGELEGLLDDPSAYLDRIRHTAEDVRGPMIAPLVEYSARRGDIAAVARQLGMAAHPAAVPVSTR